MTAHGSQRYEAGYDSVADANLDGVVNIEDLTFAATWLPAGTLCH